MVNIILFFWPFTRNEPNVAFENTDQTLSLYKVGRVRYGLVFFNFILAYTGAGYLNWASRW